MFQPKMIFTLGYGFLRGARTWSSGQSRHPPNQHAPERTPSVRPPLLLRRSLRRTRSTDITSIALALFEYPRPPSLPAFCPRTALYAVVEEALFTAHSSTLEFYTSGFSLSSSRPASASCSFSLSLLNFQSHNSAVDIPPSLRFSLSLSPLSRVSSPLPQIPSYVEIFLDLCASPC